MFKNDFYDTIAFAPLMLSLTCGLVILLLSHIFPTSPCFQTFYKLKVFAIHSKLSLVCCLINLSRTLLWYFIRALYTRNQKFIWQMQRFLFYLLLVVLFRLQEPSFYI